VLAPVHTLALRTGLFRSHNFGGMEGGETDYNVYAVSHVCEQHRETAEQTV
jgi:hypothetical protein